MGERTTSLLRGIDHHAMESGVAGAAHHIEIERAVAEGDRDQPDVARKGRKRRHRRRHITHKHAELDDIDAGCRHRFDGAAHREGRQRQVADRGADGPLPGDGAEDVANDVVGETAERALRGLLEVNDVGAAFERDQRFLGRAHAGEKLCHVRIPAVAAA